MHDKQDQVAPMPLWCVLFSLVLGAWNYSVWRRRFAGANYDDYERGGCERVVKDSADYFLRPLFAISLQQRKKLIWPHPLSAKNLITKHVEPFFRTLRPQVARTIESSPRPKRNDVDLSEGMNPNSLTCFCLLAQTLCLRPNSLLIKKKDGKCCCAKNFTRKLKYKKKKWEKKQEILMKDPARLGWQSKIGKNLRREDAREETFFPRFNRSRSKTQKRERPGRNSRWSRQIKFPDMIGQRAAVSDDRMEAK
jgi:hypothetical protein